MSDAASIHEAPPGYRWLVWPTGRGLPAVSIQRRILGFWWRTVDTEFPPLRQQASVRANIEWAKGVLWTRHTRRQQARQLIAEQHAP